MSLILDHKNGINDDNRLSNLRIVCPNCNSTLDTHCGKNTSKYRRLQMVDKTYKLMSNKCIDCNNLITDKCKRCSKCDSIKQRKVKRPSYENLLKDIKELGYLGTGRKYNVSDTSIRKWIKMYKKHGIDY